MSSVPSGGEGRSPFLRLLRRRSGQALRGKDNIALRVGKVVNPRKMAKHFELVIGDDSFSFSRKQAQISAEAALDGIYVVRASAPTPKGLSATELVVAYRDLKFNQAGFRSLKTIGLDLRPIYPYSEDRVRAQRLICMLALYLVWHLRKAWAPLCFADEAPPERTGPVARRPPWPRCRASEARTVSPSTVSQTCSTPWPPSPATRSSSPGAPPLTSPDRAVPNADHRARTLSAPSKSLAAPPPLH
jgi:hypothetical protein